MAPIQKKAMDGVKPSMADYVRFHTYMIRHHQRYALFTALSVIVFSF